MEKRTLIRGGHVLTSDAGLGEHGVVDILIEDETIVSVQPDLGDIDAEVIDAADMIVLPGLIDSHRHTWQGALSVSAVDMNFAEYMGFVRGQIGSRFTAEDMYVGTLAGALDALDSGVTTIYDWCHMINSPEHADAAVQALQDAGIRAVFAHGGGNPEWVDHPATGLSADVPRLAAKEAFAPGGLLTLAVALRGPEIGSIEATIDELGIARDWGLPVTMHVGNGTLGTHGGVRALLEAGVAGPDINWAHGCTLADDELEGIVASGGTVSTSPEVELNMGLGDPVVGRLMALGGSAGLSIDVPTGVTRDLFAAMRCLLAHERYLAHRAELKQGRELDTVGMTSREAIEMATIGGARVCGLENVTGRIGVGQHADVTIIRPNRFGTSPTMSMTAEIVMSSTAEVDTVLVAGKVRKRGGHLVDIDQDRLAAQVEESRARLLLR